MSAAALYGARREGMRQAMLSRTGALMAMRPRSLPAETELAQGRCRPSSLHPTNISRGFRSRRTAFHAAQPVEASARLRAEAAFGARLGRAALQRAYCRQNIDPGGSRGSDHFAGRTCAGSATTLFRRDGVRIRPHCLSWLHPLLLGALGVGRLPSPADRAHPWGAALQLDSFLSAADRLGGLRQGGAAPSLGAG